MVSEAAGDWIEGQCSGLRTVRGRAASWWAGVCCCRGTYLLKNNGFLLLSPGLFSTHAPGPLWLHGQRGPGSCQGGAHSGLRPAHRQCSRAGRHEQGSRPRPRAWGRAGRELENEQGCDGVGRALLRSPRSWRVRAGPSVGARAEDLGWDGVYFSGLGLAFGSHGFLSLGDSCLSLNTWERGRGLEAWGAASWNLLLR